MITLEDIRLWYRERANCQCQPPDSEWESPFLPTATHSASRTGCHICESVSDRTKVQAHCDRYSTFWSMTDECRWILGYKVGKRRVFSFRPMPTRKFELKRVLEMV